MTRVFLGFLKIEGTRRVYKGTRGVVQKKPDFVEKEEVNELEENSTIWIAISRFCRLWELGELRSEIDELSQLGALTLTLT